MKLDTLDLAYFAMGIAEHLQKSGPRDREDWEGEIGFVGHCMDIATGLDYEEPEDGFAGVFAYEVAQPLGLAVAQHLEGLGRPALSWAGQFVDMTYRNLVATMERTA